MASTWLSLPVTVTLAAGLVLSSASAFESASDNRIAAIEREVDAGLDELQLVASMPVMPSSGEIVWTPEARQPACPAQLTTASARQGETVLLEQAVCRGGRLTGWLRWRIRVDTLVESGLRTLRPYGVDVTVRDPAAAADRQLLYYHPSRRHKQRPAQALETPLRVSRAIPVGQRSWTVQCDGVPDFLKEAFSWAPFGFFCSGLGITVALALLVRQRITQMDEIELVVARRTQELETAREVAAEASRLKSEFPANVSHELRTPLNGILGMATLLEEADLQPEDRESASLVVRSARHLQSLVNDLLDMARIEAGKITIEARPFRVAELLLDVCAATRPASESKGLVLVSELAAGTAPRWVGDDVRLAASSAGDCALPSLTRESGSTPSSRRRSSGALRRPTGGHSGGMVA